MSAQTTSHIPTMRPIPRLLLGPIFTFDPLLHSPLLGHLSGPSIHSIKSTYRALLRSSSSAVKHQKQARNNLRRLYRAEMNRWMKGLQAGVVQGGKDEFEASGESPSLHHLRPAVQADKLYNDSLKHSRTSHNLIPIPWPSPHLDLEPLLPELSLYSPIALPLNLFLEPPSSVSLLLFILRRQGMESKHHKCNGQSQSETHAGGGGELGDGYDG